MIAQLRKKFILIAMGSVIAVLAVLMGIVNVANFVRIDQNASSVAQVLLENKGTFPDKFSADNVWRAQPSDLSTAPAEDSAATPPPVSGMGSRRDFSVETPYETRFFTVRLNADGSLSSVNTGKIAAVDSKGAVSMAQSLRQTGKPSGYSGNYKYLAQASDDGGSLYVFVDCTRDLKFAKAFLINSLLVSLCGIAAVLFLVLALSKRAIRPVVESYEKQKQFITNAGHEIKTPLAIIDSCAEVLELEQGGNKWTEGIRSQVGRLSSLTKSLVALSRMDEGSAELAREDFSLTDAVQETLAPFVLLAERHHLSLTFSIQAGITYCGNEPAIRQLCSILADNAVKYALAESEIHFTLLKKGKKILLQSENAADSLQKGDQRILFDRFYRGDASRSSEKSGYGIGLSMAQSIVTAHGGKIEAYSEDGAHLTITVQL
ncbi:MAG: HAMP domain-containing histidine kinase [Oscillibacter sp.]|jgi:signal transduction histidine kinase|nr:HAMP domain-containing histidine kinase [Oscillibacter sp.]